MKTPTRFALAAALTLAALPAARPVQAFDLFRNPVTDAIGGALNDAGRAVGGAVGGVVQGGVEGIVAVGAGASQLVQNTGQGLQHLGASVAGPVGAAIATINPGQLGNAAAAEARRIGGLARSIGAALPDPGTAARIADAIGRGDTRTAQALILSLPQLNAQFGTLRAMGFHTMTVGIESSGAYGVGVGRETGIALDLDGGNAPRLYAATAAAAGFYAGVGNDLVFSFYRAENGAIGGHAVGTVAEFDVGVGPGLNMWFSPAPFDFAGFALGVGVGSVGGGGAVTYAFTEVY